MAARTPRARISTGALTGPLELRRDKHAVLGAMTSNDFDDRSSGSRILALHVDTSIRKRGQDFL
jgi:hypothetical protein